MDELILDELTSSSALNCNDLGFCHEHSIGRTEVDSTTWIILFISIAVGTVIQQIINRVKKNKQIVEQLDKIDQQLNRLSNFKVSQGIIGEDCASGIALDEGRNKVCLITNNSGRVYLEVINYQDILSSEIYENGQTVTKVSRTSQIGGAIVGGLAFGGVGAIIGGLSGKTTSSDEVHAIGLRLTINNTKDPIHDVYLGNEESYEQATENVRHWHGLISVLIKRADEEDKQHNSGIPESRTNNSIADELDKLAQLKGEGILSEKEFQDQKQKLLTGPQFS